MSILLVNKNKSREDFIKKLQSHFCKNLANLSFEGNFSVKLFGSYARGDFGPSSDVDIAVCYNGHLSENDKAILTDTCYEVADDLVFADLSKKKMSFINNIEKDGVTLYEH